MTTSSSSIPVLGPVLYFTSTDGYSYDVDNRPLLHLDTNIRHINTALVGIGYGEHASHGGGVLTPGRAVSLFPNGSVFYPTGSPSTSPTENIVGLVIGATDTGLNRVIWSSKHLDLDVLGLSFISSSQLSGAYLVTTAGTDGVIAATVTPNLATQFVVGRIKSGPYIEVNTSTDLISGNVALAVGNAVKDNHANLYGFHRLRNLLLYTDIGQTPVQYSKRTVRISDYAASNGGVRNPMAAALSSPDYSSILPAAVDSTAYGTTIDSLVLKERYTQFLNTGITPEQVSCGIITSTWATLAYSSTLPSSGSENYELQKFGAGLDYSTTNNKPILKAFTIDKYYQYVRAATGPLVGKVQATATVFNPTNTNTDEGGEATQLIVFDFYDYNTSNGLETYKHRIVLDSGSAQQALMANVGSTGRAIFPQTLIQA